jgi:hypothetical protein
MTVRTLQSIALASGIDQCIDRKRAGAILGSTRNAKRAGIALNLFSYPTFARSTVLEETCALAGDVPCLLRPSIACPGTRSTPESRNSTGLHDHLTIIRH